MIPPWRRRTAAASPRANPASAVLRTLLLALPAFTCWPAAAGAKAGEASFWVEVPAQAWKGVRVKNIPAGAELSVEAHSDGAVAVLLLHDDQYASFPGRSEALFRGASEGNLSFSLRAPRSGDYYVILDNRGNAAPRAVDLSVRGETDEPAPEAGVRATPSRAPARSAEARLAELRAQLALVFAFDPFPIEIDFCGRSAVLDEGPGVTLCREYASALYRRSEDRALASTGLLFTLFHAVGHVLLAQWGEAHPEDEERADEFALATLRMLGGEGPSGSLANLFGDPVALGESLGPRFAGDPHLLTLARARALAREWSEPGLVRRWQPVFVPRLRSSVLEALRRKPEPWTDVALVEAELAARGR